MVFDIYGWVKSINGIWHIWVGNSNTKKSHLLRKKNRWWFFLCQKYSLTYFFFRWWIHVDWLMDWLIDWFSRHINRSWLILCIKIKELRSLWVNIYIFVLLFLKRFLFLFLFVCFFVRLIFFFFFFFFILCTWSYRIRMILKQIYLTHRWDPNKCYNSWSELTKE